MKKEGRISDNIPGEIISRLSRLVSSRAGLYFPEERWKDLKRGAGAAARELGFKDTASFIDRLSNSSPDGKQFYGLIRHLTIGETFFFRDKKIFQILRDHIITGRLGSKNPEEKRISFWSAGCSTGEEPYSIAMLLDQMKHLHKGWETIILASDINPRFLEKAERGIYTRWSFRETPDHLIEKYFKKRGKNRYEITPRIKKMVRFFRFNLADDAVPSQAQSIRSFDVIFCRNVLMYFSQERRDEIVKRLSDRLLDGGWLIVSPSEAPFIHHPGLHTVRFSGAVLYRKGLPRKEDLKKIKPVQQRKIPGKMLTMSEDGRKKDRQVKRHALSDMRLKKSQGLEIKIPEYKEYRRKTDTKDVEQGLQAKPDIYQEALILYKKGAYDASAKSLKALPAKGQNRKDTFLLTSESMVLPAKNMADMGRLDEARGWCEKAISEEKLNPGHYYLMATIRQEQGDLEDAITFLKKTIYLDPEFIMAHFAMANLLRKTGKHRAAERYLSNARSLLLSMERETVVPNSEGMTAGRLVEVIQSMMSNG